MPEIGGRWLLLLQGFPTVSYILQCFLDTCRRNQRWHGTILNLELCPSCFVPSFVVYICVLRVDSCFALLDTCYTVIYGSGTGIIVLVVVLSL